MGLAFTVDMLKRLRGGTDRECDIMQGGIGNDAVESPFQFAYTATLRTSDKLDDRGRDSEANGFGFGTQDRQTVFVFRGLNICQQSPFKARTQAVLQAMNGLRGTVAGNDDLLIGIMKRIKGMKEFLLGRFFACDELNIVN